MLRRRVEVQFDSQVSALGQGIAWLELAVENGFSHLNPRQIMDDIILDDNLSLSPLFRYCLARGDEHSEFREEFSYGAVVQYITNMKHFGVVWDAWIPDELKERACAAFGIKTS